MLYAGLDLSRKRLDFHLLDREGTTVELGASPPGVEGLRGLTQRLARHGQPIRAAIESMNGARFVHDRLELAGWQVEIADAQKVKGLAPLACKTDRIDAWVLAELARRDRRHRPLPHSAQARRLQRPLPARLPIRRARPARPALKAGTALPALGARRGSHACLHRARLPRPLPADQGADRQAARRQGRP